VELQVACTCRNVTTWSLVASPAAYSLVPNVQCLRQVNGVKGEDTVFVRCMSVCPSVVSGPVNQTSLKRLTLWTSGQSGYDL